MLYLALAAGGILGGILRYLVESVPNFTTLPLDTLWVNLSGAMVLGMLNGCSEQIPIKPWLRISLGTGAMGAFTTFSAFCLDLTRIHATGLAALYLVTTLIGGPLLALVGQLLLSFVLRRARQTAEEVSV